MEPGARESGECLPGHRARRLAMTIGAGLILIAVGAILRFAISTVSTHGFGIHTIGDILMLVGALGVVLWLLGW